MGFRVVSIFGQQCEEHQPTTRMSVPTVVRIEDLAEKAPRIEVVGAPFGYNVYVGPLVNNPALEHGALINLLGVDQAGTIEEQGWRFVDPALPADVIRNGLNIVWISHDRAGPFGNGDLQIGFNCVLPGQHYSNPIHTTDKPLSDGEDDWITVVSNPVFVLEFKPRAQAVR